MTNETETAAPSTPAPTDAWRAALSSRKTEVADPGSVPAAAVTAIDADVSRRTFIRASFWGGLGISLLGSVGTLLDFLYPRNVKGFGGPVPAGNVKDFANGADPKMFSEGQFWLVNLDPTETRPGGANGGEGLVALWRKCPHLGCSVPWIPAFDYAGDKGWFRCPVPRLHLQQGRRPCLRTSTALDGHDEDRDRRRRERRRANGHDHAGRS